MRLVPPETRLTGGPQHQRLVIEFVSIKVETPRWQVPTAFITTWAQSEPVRHSIALTSHGSHRGVQVFAATHRVRLYADPGTTVTADIGRRPCATGEATALFTISGYRTDEP